MPECQVGEVQGAHDHPGDRRPDRRALGEVLPRRFREIGGERRQSLGVVARLVRPGIEVVGEVLEEDRRELRVEGTDAVEVGEDPRRLRRGSGTLGAMGWKSGRSGNPVA